MVVKENFKNDNNFFTKLIKSSSKTKIIIILIIFVVLSLFLSSFFSSSKKIKFSAESSLEKVVDMNNLETVTYTYNAIARQCKKTNCSSESTDIDDYKYFVSYEGTVTAGIDFKQVKIDVDKKAKKLIIDLPEPIITGHNVDISKLKFIFKGEKYNEASELENAFKLCKRDLENRTTEDDLILKTAKDNSISVLKGFYEPMIKKIDKDYIIEFK